MARTYRRDSNGRFSSGGGSSRGVKATRRAQMDAASSNLRQRASAARKAIPKGKGPGASSARSAVAASIRADRRTISQMRSALGVSRGSKIKSKRGSRLGGGKPTDMKFGRKKPVTSAPIGTVAKNFYNRHMGKVFGYGKATKVKPAKKK